MSDLRPRWLVMDLERLTEALEWVDSGPTVVGAEHIIALAAAARAYRDLLANGAEPDYEAAFKKCRAWFTRPDGTPHRKPSELYAAAYEIVEVAIGVRLLVDPTTEEER